ncbi:MAG: lytic murein transglycosylase B [Thiotrichales bacterium]
MDFSRFLLPVWLCLFGVTGAVQANGGLVQRGDYLQREDVRLFVRDLQAEGFPAARAEAMLAQAVRQQKVLDLIQRPAEGKPWNEYRDIFVTDRRIKGGVRFWNENEKWLRLARERYGVPEEIMVGIIGVETFYGAQMGQHKVFDALVTLSFDYPPRSPFFTKELKNFLLLTQEEPIDPFGVQGSYAGAMGMGQFMPSSYRAYAVDFDGDGRRDLWRSAADGIGSVANYFKVHGWVAGEPVVAPARVAGDAYLNLEANNRKPSYALAELKRAGISPEASIGEHERLVFMNLEGVDGSEFWIGHQNFYVITQYNHSVKYALAVYQLAEAIKQQRQQQAAWSNTR